MKKRKKFTVAKDITQGISDVIKAVNNNAGNFRYEVIALSRVETDPENPRELEITSTDIINGIEIKDSKNNQKIKEKKALETLVATIKTKGVLNPIVVYKHDNKYRIIAGERRFLASLLANKEDIHARILDVKPDLVAIRSIQWIENNERENLTLHERLQNLKAILTAYTIQNPTEEVSIEVIKKLTGLSIAQSSYYLAVLNASSDLKEAIALGKIRNLDKAAYIANIKEATIRSPILDACIEGYSIKELKKLREITNKLDKISQIKTSNSRKGRIAQQVNFGKTKDITVVKKLFDIILEQPNYSHYKNSFSEIDWTRYDQVTTVFKRLIEILSKR